MRSMSELTFRGLEWCDGCGARLAPGDRLAGICPACQRPEVEGSVPRRGRGQVHQDAQSS